MKAEIINTGTELFFDEITNINLAYISNRLIETGWEPIFHTTVPDNLDHLVIALHTALKRVRLVIVTGGLGPTSDDLTRFAIALATRRELHFNELAYQSLKRYFDRIKIAVPPINRIQAEIPTGAQVLPNRLGTAPGFWLKISAQGGGSASGGKDKLIIALPGMPEELKDIFKYRLINILSRQSGKPSTLISDKFLLFGISEAHLQEHINNLQLPEEITPSITVANNGVISLRLFVSGNGNTRARQKDRKILTRAVSMTKGCLGKLIFGTEEDTMESVVAKLLIDRKCTLAVAESCTGGLVSHRLSKTPGISAVFKEGLVCYSNESKIKRLGIPARIIKRYGAVSEKVAGLMAHNIIRTERTNLGVAITGIAGPTGGTPDKPVGLVYIAIHSRNNYPRDEVLRYEFPGPRIMVQERTATTAINLLRLKLLARNP